MRYSLTEWEIFLVFFSFLARNGLKFLVSREKSKCEKNPTYSQVGKSLSHESTELFSVMLGRVVILGFFLANQVKIRAKIKKFWAKI